MTQFEDLERLYNRFINLTNEINAMIKNEDYASAAARVADKSKLIKTLSQAKKTTSLTEEQRQKLELLEQDMREDYQKTISSMIKLQDEVGIELLKAKKRIKVGNAYSIQNTQSNGGIVDFTE